MFFNENAEKCFLFLCKKTNSELNVFSYMMKRQILLALAKNLYKDTSINCRTSLILVNSELLVTIDILDKFLQHFLLSHSFYYNSGDGFQKRREICHVSIEYINVPLNQIKSISLGEGEIMNKNKTRRASCFKLVFHLEFSQAFLSVFIAL